MLWYACAYDETITCRYDPFKMPMISGVICLPYLDWIWCILTTFFTLTVQQSNIRAYYAKLYPYATKQENDNLMMWGLIMIFSFVLIGYFDEHNYKIIHFTLAFAFFISSCLYSNFLAGKFKKYRDCFPLEEQKHINWMDALSYLMYIGLFLMMISKLVHIDTALCEWATGIMFIGYFALASFVNPYYDSVMPADSKSQ